MEPAGEPGGGGGGGGKKVPVTLSPLDRPPFEVRPMHISGPPHDYNAETDPYMPFTRTNKFKKHMINTEGAHGAGMLMSRSLSNLGDGAETMSLAERYSSTMVAMERVPVRGKETFPKVQVQNDSLPTGGVTFSREPTSSAEESKCELDILKAVLNREGYLNRLEKAVRTINKKFKPEVSDILDLVRAASTEVVECIVRWREAKRDHSAAFNWNKVNYLLKMASDLDYLHDYLAVRKWMGFTLIRNPFCVPYPLDEGAGMFADRVLNPKHIEPGQQSDGFMIGGLTQGRLRKEYTPSAPSSSAGGRAGSKGDGGSSRVASREQSASGRNSSPPRSQQGGKAAPSPYSAPAGFFTKAEREALPGAGGGGLPSSFILNSDMAKIRQAELVVLKEEEKFGRWSRDPTGRLVPALQAYTRLATIELRRDDLRPIDQAAVSTTFAPHALNSDVGVVADPWLPEDKGADRFATSALLKQFDDDVIPHDRGRGSSGGALNPITLKGVSTRPRRPLRPDVGSAIEFNRYRRKKTIGDRLNEISKLREEIKREREMLDEERKRMRSASKSPKRKPRASSSAGGDGGLGGTSPPPSRGQQGSLSRGAVSFDLGATSPVGGGQGSASQEGKSDAASSGHTQPYGDGERKSSGEKGGEEEEEEGGEGGDDGRGQDEGEGQALDEKAMREAKLGRIRSKERELQARLEAANEQEKTLRRDLDHINKDEMVTVQIKAVDHKKEGSERSREIERKRRLLTAEQGQRKGLPLLEDQNAYDYYAKKCQSVIRGWLTRCYTRWYREASRKAARAIQACMRGKLARIRVAKRKINDRAQTSVAKVYRGYKARNASAKMAKNKNLGKSCVLIQKTYRGRIGRKRAVAKRQLDKAAEIAKVSVDPRSVYVSDVKELARRINYAIEEPETSAFPPDEVLQLLRISTVVMQQSRGQLGLSEYSYINARYYYEVEGETMTWHEGVKMLNRSERMLRMMRSLAFGPAAKPPRIVSLSSTAKLLLAGLSASPRWRRETFEDMGMGCKFCMQLFDWLNSIGTVAARQSEFLPFLASSFPDWLPKLHDIQRDKRRADFEREVNLRCIQVLQDFRSRSADDARIVKALDENMRKMNIENKAYSEEMEQSDVKEEALMKQQSSREDLAIVGMEVKLEQGQENLAKLTSEYRKLMQADNLLAKERAVEVRADLVNLELSVKELGTQLRLLKLQVDNNGATRKEPGGLPLEARIKAQAAGEARALEFISKAKQLAFLDDAGVRHAEHLEPEFLPMNAKLEAATGQAHADYWTAYKAADEERKAYDMKVTRDFKVAQAKEISSKDNVRPTDEEMEEERREDEKEAVEERLKKVQFIPDHALFHPHPSRPRPVIIGLGRDLPGNAKTRIVQEVTRLMPGLFVYLDHPANMGLCLQDMQAALDAKKCIIMTLDHGLSRMTRMGFLKSFEVTVRALIPNPFVVMAIGDDWNRRGSGGSHFGASKLDLQNMRDCDIKAAMETMAWCVHEFCKPDASAAMIRLSAEVVPPSQAFVTVMEGFFVTQSGSEDFASPDQNMAALSWRFTQRMLSEPRKMAARLREFKRGSASTRLVQCLQRYLGNTHWPAPHSRERSDDKLLHLFALFVEAFVTTEKSTLERGGIPPTAMSRTSMKGIQSVEVVVDSLDAEDRLFSPAGGGWRMAAAKLVRVALQDLRTLKTVLRIGDALLNVCAYREGSLVYLDTYDATTSATHIACIRLAQIGFLLMPNAAMADAAENGHVPPPQSPNEMYAALARLLRFEPFVKSRADSRLRLSCRRDFTFLRQVNTKLNGHAALIKCYEAALGQLFFSAYLPEYSAVVTCMVAEKERLGLLENADPHYEYHVVEENDARKLLRYAIDRLKISPNQSMVRVARGGADLHDGYRKKQGKASALLAQGFSISMRVHGGCGRVASRKIRSFSSVPHIVETRVVSETSMLIVSAYEPRSRATMRVTMQPFFRRLLLLSDSADPRGWMPALLRRLKVDWRGKHELVVDRTLLRVVRKVAGERMVLSISLVDEEHVRLTLLNQSISMSFAADLAKEDVIRLLLYSPPLDVIEKQFGVQVTKPGVRAILQGAKTKDPTKAKEAASAGGDAAAAAAAEAAAHGKELHPSTFDVSLESVLREHYNLTHLANQCSAVLTRIRADSYVYGFKFAQPIQVEVPPVASVTGKVEFDTKARTEPRLKQAPREPTVASLLRARRQMPFTHMEEELNALAAAKAAAAEQALLAIVAANKEVEAHFLGLSESDYNALAGVPPGGEDNVILSEATKEDLRETLAEEAAALVASTLVDTIEERSQRREVERSSPGVTQEVRRLAILSGAGDGTHMVEIDAHLVSAEDREILGRGERKVFEGGVKTQFRDSKAVWAGHVAMKVYETMCWQGSDGLGRRLRFEVYEPSSGGYYDGLVRNNLHLKGIVGRHGFDMLVKSRTSELIMFIAKYKMFVVDNSTTWDGEPSPEGAPTFRIEFESERIYTGDKVTPVNAGEAEDARSNQDKLFEMEIKRGKKITRLVRRLASLLMQLTVFEIATAPEDAAAVAASPYGADPLEGKSDAELLLLAAQAQGGAAPGSVNFAALGGTSLPGGEGRAEERAETKMKRFVPPTFRIIGYDPRSKRKAIYIASPAAVLEIAGGVYSPFLDPVRRRELAQIVCDALALNFPKGKPFELLLNWSGADREKVKADVAVASKVKSAVSRSSAEQVLKRTGRLFRAACRIGKIECLVTLYTVDLPKANTGDGRPPERQLVVNLYSRACSDATEIVVSEEEQLARLGRTLASFADGDVRTAAVRRFLRFIRADLIDDPKDPDDPKPPKLLHALLLPPGKDFQTEYHLVREAQEGEVRPIGCPAVFMPPNTLGRVLHRRGMNLQNRAPDLDAAAFLVTVYTVKEEAGPERGLIIRVYDKTTCETAVLHLGYKEMQRQCEEAGEPDLIRDVVNAIQEVSRVKLDKTEEAFEFMTERGGAGVEAKRLTDMLVDIVLDDLGIDVSPTQHVVPYLKSMRRGHQIRYD